MTDTLREELCWSRGPRIGDEGQPYCLDLLGHDNEPNPTPHRSHPESGFNEQWAGPRRRASREEIEQAWLPDELRTPTPRPDTVSTEWVVHVQGMDDVLPALSRRDAYERAHKANTGILWNETHRKPRSSDAYAPIAWAVPIRVDRSPYPPEMTAREVEDAWKDWLG